MTLTDIHTRLEAGRKRRRKPYPNVTPELIAQLEAELAAMHAANQAARRRNKMIRLAESRYPAEQIPGILRQWFGGVIPTVQPVNASASAALQKKVNRMKDQLSDRPQIRVEGRTPDGKTTRWLIVQENKYLWFECARTDHSLLAAAHSVGFRAQKGHTRLRMLASKRAVGLLDAYEKVLNNA